ncbi:MAG: hypothetical protein IPK44_24870 [Candidatus Accumulibacter sp.]|uniref:hypothetical protein n=1 Tax=Accumulibacter sp. TaxID=2053492 RepID=UPI0025893310|nr:hypothetical protein [Accumulibacter sp.]MBK8117523.1 hypothetical protein [Accumulibacter sp.]
MIERYEVGGKRYLHVVNFTKHQNPHRDEKASTIPAPGSNGVRSEQAPCEHHANTVQALCEHHANTVAIGLIPDSLIPDSLIPESKTGAAGHPGDLARPEKPAAGAAVRFDAAGFLVEQGADPQTAADYLTLRKAKKAASTHTALRSVVAEAAKAGMPVQAVLTTCCARGWAGFKAEWAANRPGPGHRQTIHEQRKATPDELTDEAEMQPKNLSLATSPKPKSSALPEPWIERLLACFEAM